MGVTSSSTNIEAFSKWCDNIQVSSIPRWDDLPDLDLYMDQVIVLMNKYLSSFNAASKDNFITPSMINNYVKLNIMPAPEKKKYSKVHIAYLIIICLMKQAISITAIKDIINKELESYGIKELLNIFATYYEEKLKELTTYTKEKFIVPDFSMSSISINMGISANISRLISESAYMVLSSETGLAISNNKKEKDTKK